MSLREFILEQNEGLTFTPEDHKYMYKGKEFVSATTVLKNYFPFDATSAADLCLKGRKEKYAHCKTRQDVFDVWRGNADFGTAVHKFCEDFLNGDFVSVENEWQASALKYLQNLHFEEAHSEVLLCAPQWGIAGTADLIIKIRGKWYIYDFKTDEVIRKEGFGGSTCVGVLTGIPNSNYHKFVMQLGLYTMIMEQVYDLPIAGRVIVHITPTTCTEYHLEYLVDEVGAVVQMHTAGMSPPPYIKK